MFTEFPGMPVGLWFSCAVGLAGMVLFVVARVFLGDGEPAGAIGFRPPLPPPFHVSRLSLVIAMTAGLVLLVGSWSLLLLAAARRSCSMTLLAVTTGLWSVPVLVAPPLFSRDVYSYLAFGIAVDRGLDPYVFRPADLPDPHLVEAVAPNWRETPMVYGPLFGRTAALLTDAEHLVVSVALFRLAAVVAVVAAFVAARALTDDPRLAAAAILMNPVVLVHGLGGLHVDVFVAGLLVVAVVAELRGRPGPAVALASAAVLFKATSVVAVGGLVLLHLAAAPAWSTRARRLAVDVSVAAGTLVVGSFATVDGWGWVPNLVVPAAGGGETVKTPYVVFERLVGSPVALPIWVLLAVGVLLAVNLAGRLRLDVAERVGISMVVGVLMAPVLYAWYLLPGIVVLGAVHRPAALRVHVVATAVGLTLTLFDLRELVRSATAVCVLVPLVAAASALLWAAGRYGGAVGVRTEGSRA